MACQDLGFGEKLLIIVQRMASKGDETGGKTAVAKVNVGDDEVLT